MKRTNIKVGSMSIGGNLIVGDVYNNGQAPAEQIGPRTVQLGQVRSCAGCKYHNQIGIRFGWDSNDYNHFCEHPSVLEQRSFMGLSNGRMIGKSSGQPIATPDWCPVLNVKAARVTKNE